MRNIDPTVDADGSGVPKHAAWWRSQRMLLAAAALIVLGTVAGESMVALAIVLMDGVLALAVLAAAALAGGWIVRGLGLRDEPWSCRLVIGSALGIGILSLMVLGLGSAGLLTRAVAAGLVVVLAALGLTQFMLDARRLVCNRSAFSTGGPRGLKPAAHWYASDEIEPVHWLWLAVCPFLVIALLAACLPPGVLWREEGFGYDVLEYHLAVPKTYFTEGGIGFLPYNVYSNFPSNSEMLSLLMMTLRGDAIEASFMATIANVGLAGLFVAAAWLAGRSISPSAGVLAGVLAGITPWVAYLAGIAYVEPGMLAMGMSALAVMLRTHQGNRPNRWLWSAGLLAGLACGYKYTAVPLIALPLALFPLFMRVGWAHRFKGVLIVGAGAAITFAPWMLRNMANTGNPVFPLAYSVFGANHGIWNDELEARWQAAHGMAAIRADDRPLAVQAFQRTIGDFRLGMVMVVLAIAGALRRQDRWTVALLLMLVLQTTVWIAATHLFARFAVVMLLPIVALASRALEDLRSARMRRLVWVVVLVGAGWNLYQLMGLYYDHTRPGPAREPVHAYGRTDWFSDGAAVPHLKTINSLIGDVNVMMVGDARSFYIRPPCEYAVVFNDHPLAEAVRQARGDATSVLQWLQQRGTTHVFVHWGEMKRLRRSYGFYPAIDAELFDRLCKAGLKRIDSFTYQEGWPAYGSLYEVPQDE